MNIRVQDPETLVRWAAWFGLLGIGLGCISAINRVSPDLYHEMALAREAISRGAVPTRDLFAYTRTVEPCVHHEWGAGVVFYLASRTLGSAGMLVLKYGGALVVMGGCLALARRRGASMEVAASLAPLAILCACIGFFSVRAQLFTLIFTLVLLWLLERDREGRRTWILVWLPVYVLWLNLHAGFLVGVGLLVIYTAGRFLEAFGQSGSPRASVRAAAHLVGVGGAMLLLIGCNPYGWHYAGYLWHAVRLERPFVTEWQPVWHFPRMLVVYGISLLPLLTLVRRPSARQWTELLMVLVPAILAFQHVRHLSIYAVVWACYVPALIDRRPIGGTVRKLWADHRTAIIALWLVLGVLGISQAMRNRFWDLRVPTTYAEDSSLQYPVGAVEYLREQSFAGKVLVPFEAGAFVSWKLYPAVLISCDGRYEVAFPPQQVQELWDFYATQRNWQQTLRRYPPDLILVPRPNPLEQLLTTPRPAAEDAWQQVYCDDGFTLYARHGLAGRLPAVDRRGQDIVADFP